MHKFRLSGLFPTTIALRDPFFYPMKGKEDLDVIVAPLFYHSWMQSVFLTIQTVSLTFQYTRCAFIKFSQIHVPCFKWRNADPTVWGLHGNLSEIRPAHDSSSPLWILWEPTPTRFHLLYKAPGESFFLILQILEFSRSLKLSISTDLLNDLDRMIVKALGVGWPRIRTRARKLSHPKKPGMLSRSRMT